MSPMVKDKQLSLSPHRVRFILSPLQRTGICASNIKQYNESISLIEVGVKGILFNLESSQLASCVY
jgi:hypothetical protein